MLWLLFSYQLLCIIIVSLGVILNYLSLFSNYSSILINYSPLIRLYNYIHEIDDVTLVLMMSHKMDSHFLAKYNNNNTHI